MYITLEFYGAAFWISRIIVKNSLRLLMIRHLAVLLLIPKRGCLKFEQELDLLSLLKKNEPYSLRPKIRFEEIPIQNAEVQAATFSDRDGKVWSWDFFLF